LRRNPFSLIIPSVSTSSLPSIVQKGTFYIIQKIRDRLFVRALHMVIVIIVCKTLISSRLSFNVRKTLLLSRKNVDRESEWSDWQLIAIAMHFFHLFMIPFLNRKKGILFVRNRLFYLQVFM
jgi:hypothetical protein